MTNVISADLSKFTHALNEGKRIDCNRKGKWYQEGVLMRFVRWLFGWKDARVLKVASAFNSVLDKLEKIPVTFNADAGVMKEQAENFDLHLKAAEAVKKQLQKFKTKNAQWKLNELNLRIVALKYRIEAVNGGVSKKTIADEELVIEMQALAQKWKNSYPLYVDKKLSLQEKEKLSELCQYPEFAEVLKLDSGLRGLFFKWALRDNCEVGAFVQFPTTSARIKAAFMAGRIGRFASQIKMLQQKPVQGDEYTKDLMLPFEVQEAGKLKVRDISILTDNQVVNTANNYKRTVKQIIASFANRNSEPGNFEMLGKRYLESGDCLAPRIANHNSLELGPYNPKTKDFDRPDLSKGQEEFWKEIPPLETIELEDVKKMYGVKNLKDGEWVAAVRSTREDTGLDVDRSHGFIDVLIPDGKGRYELYAFGKYAASWPATFIEKALFITNTLKSKIECPDENHFMAQRQQAIAPRVLKPKDGLELMEDIRKDLVKAQEGNIVFQFPWENCAWWAQKLLERLLGPEKYGGPIPNYYRSPLLNATPQIPMLRSIFRFCNKLKGKVQTVAVKIIEFILFSWRGTTVVEKGKKVFKAVTHSSHMKKLEIYHPSTLHERIISGEVKGSITMGHFFLPQVVK